MGETADAGEVWGVGWRSGGVFHLRKSLPLVCSSWHWHTCNALDGSLAKSPSLLDVASQQAVCLVNNLGEIH